MLADTVEAAEEIGFALLVNGSREDTHGSPPREDSEVAPSGGVSPWLGSLGPPRESPHLDRICPRVTYSSKSRLRPLGHLSASLPVYARTYPGGSWTH